MYNQLALRAAVQFRGRTGPGKPGKPGKQVFVVLDQEEKPGKPGKRYWTRKNVNCGPGKNNSGPGKYKFILSLHNFMLQ